MNIQSVTDGTSNTLMIAEAVTGVPWTKPEDLSVHGGSLLPKLGGQFKEGFVGVTADGHPRFMKNSINKKLNNVYDHTQWRRINRPLQRG